MSRAAGGAGRLDSVRWQIRCRQLVQPAGGTPLRFVLTAGVVREHNARCSTMSVLDAVSDVANTPQPGRGSKNGQKKKRAPRFEEPRFLDLMKWCG
jgi:hypothetical protein